MSHAHLARCWLALAVPVVLAVSLVVSPFARLPVLVSSASSAERLFLVPRPAPATPTPVMPVPTIRTPDVITVPRPPSPAATAPVARIPISGDPELLGAVRRAVTAAAAPPATPAAAAGDRFAAVETLLADGDVEGAKARLGGLVTSANPSEAARAQFLLARVFLVSDDSAQATSTLTSYLEKHSSEADAAAASFALAEQLRQAGHADQAWQLYQAYLDRTSDHALDGLALLRQADAAKDADAAIGLYRRGVLAGLPAADEVAAAEKVGQYLGANQGSAAVATWYATVAQRPGTAPSIRAHYQVLAGDAYRRGGQAAAAEALYRQVVADAPSATEMVAAAVALHDLGKPLSDLTLGDAYLRSGRFADAAAVYGHFIDNNPTSPDVATARFGRGRALLDAGDDAAAAGQLQKFLANHSGDPRAGDAALLLGKALYADGDTNGSVAALTAFAGQHLTDSLAASALWEAVQELQDDGRATDARPAEDAILTSFAASTYAPRIVFNRGWDAYERLDFAGARSFWETVRARWPTSPGSSAALLWLGKLDQKAGDAASARRDFTLAWSANPGDFYALRGGELASDASSRNGTSVVAPSSEELARERAAFETWLAGWTGTSPSEASKPYLDAPIARTPTFPRLRALLAIGLDGEARQEVERAMILYGDDPRSLYAIADVLGPTDLTRESMTAAYHLLLLSPAPNSYQAPTYLQRLVYPFPYQDLIESAAQTYHVDPLLLVALVRQESGFDPTAHSSADAQGLTQMVPATAASLADHLGLAGFSPADLARPRVAIQLGAAYLGALVRQYDGDPYLAIIAYNAGSGMLGRWLADNPRHDVDLLAQEIGFKETRDYLRNVYRYYQEYQAVYRPTSWIASSGG